MPREKISFWAVWAVGVGGMVGGIFPVLGLAVQISAGGVPLAFGIAGAVALITTYAYANLSVAYPCRGGTVTFFNQAFGSGVLSGTLNILLWLSYIVMLSLYFSAFASYGVSLFTKSEAPFWKHLAISLAILGTTQLNLVSANRFGKAQSWIVGFNLFILILFVGMGIGSIDIHQLEPNNWAPLPSLGTAGMMIFLSYEGFELIANTAEDVVNPNDTLPLAYYSAVVFVIVLYVLVAIITVGNSPVEQIVAAQDYALAAAAKPFMGEWGVMAMAIAAMLSAISASNATLYGSARFFSAIASSRGLYCILQKKSNNRSAIGLVITSGITLIIANFFDLERIATMGSAGFLLIFAAVNLANFRLGVGVTRRRHCVQDLQWLSLGGSIICLASLAVLIWQAVQTDPQTVWVLVLMIGVALGVEVIYCLLTNRQIHL